MHEEASPSIEGDGHLCGNFHNYYNFHPPEQRTSFIPASHFVDLWRSLGQPAHLLLLDVGCNEGNLSIELHMLASTALQEHSCQVKLLGVDIDPELIERARAKSNNTSLQFLVADVMSSSGRGVLREYLDSNASSTFDFGLKDFLRMCGEHTRAELLVEPQPRKCYYNARQRLRKRRLDFPRFLDQIDTKTLDTDKLISDIISSLGSFQENVTVLGHEDWGRSLIVYEKNALL